MQDKITIADAPDCLNTNDKAMWTPGYQAAIEARSPRLLQIQEPPTKTEALAHYSQQAILAMDEAAPAALAVPDALREAEAALEVAIARILKADPGHSISVTSEAKALVAVRAALSATPAADIGNPITGTTAPVALPEPDGFLESHPFGPIYHRGKPSQIQMICGACPPMYEAGTVRAVLANVQAPQEQADARDAELKKVTQAYNELSCFFHDEIVAQQAAWIEWRHGAGAEAAMGWIENGLCGPGHIPDEEAPYGKEAQAWFDANQSDPLPLCQCGRPSNSLWMGKGFCSNEHYNEHRAAIAAQAAQGEGK